MDETGNRNQAQPAGEKIAAVAGLEILLFAARETITYFTYYLKAPVFLCFVGMMGAVMGVVQDVYLRAPVVSAPMANAAANQLHLDTAGFLKLYFVASTVWYLLNIPVRIWRGKSEKLSFIDRFLIVAGIATLGWGFVIANVPYLRVAPGTSRMGLAGTFFFFYFLTLAAFAAALRLSRLGDQVSEAGNRYLLALRRQLAAPSEQGWRAPSGR